MSERMTARERRLRDEIAREMAHGAGFRTDDEPLEEQYEAADRVIRDVMTYAQHLAQDCARIEKTQDGKDALISFARVFIPLAVSAS